MKVQEGKTYEVRCPKLAVSSGRPSKITIERLFNTPDSYNAFSNEGICYTTEGKYFLDGEDSYMDLVKEVIEKPIDLEYEKFMEHRTNEVHLYDTKGDYSHTEIRD